MPVAYKQYDIGSGDVYGEPDDDVTTTGDATSLY